MSYKPRRNRARTALVAPDRSPPFALRWMGVAVLAALVLLTTGCAVPSALTEFEFAVVNADQANQQAAESRRALAAIEGDVNRLLIVGTDGNIFTMSPTSGNRVELTSGASARLLFRQPTWNPVGDQIAWTQVRTADDGVENTLITSDIDGSNRIEVNVPFPPFYLSWSPNGERLAYLSNWMRGRTPSMALRLVDLAEETVRARTLAEGQPFYFWWAPDSENMITHIGNERLMLQTASGQQETLQSTSVGFPAPQWSMDGERLFFAFDDEQARRLVVADATGEVQDEITRFDGRVSFTLSPNDQQLAYIVTDESVSAAALGPLYVIDLATQRTIELSSEPVFAFFWSPDSTKLAYLSLEETNRGAALRWNVWDGESRRTLQRFSPSRTFLNEYLVFFDQYAQSMTIWSPDSTAFTYAGSDISGTFGVWVQPLELDEPVYITNGTLSSWSPR